MLKLMCDEFSECLCCPICRSKLRIMEDQCTCLGCGKCFPIVQGAPVLLNESNSLFSIDDFLTKKDTTYNLKTNFLKRLSKKCLPNIGKNINARKNLIKFAQLLHFRSVNPHVLILGGSIIGDGVEFLIQDHSMKLVESDVSFGARTILICDAHDIPFNSGIFDGVILQAVLEHVVDPYRCVEEAHRVLRPNGIIYAETPFMQQVHMGRYDFTRFTHLGHRRLFRKFEEIDSGAACGPGMALAWAYQNFLLSFFQSKILRKFIRVFAALTSFYLKYFDYYLVNKAGAFDSASGYYFLGSKGNVVLTDRELITLYKGLV